MAYEEFLCGATAEQRANLVEHLLLRRYGAFFREVPCRTEGLASRHNGHLDERIGILQEPRHGGVSCLVDGNAALFFLGHYFRGLFQSADDAVYGVEEVLLTHRLAVVSCGDEGCLVADVGNVGTREARRLAGEHLDVERTVRLERREVNLEDGYALGKFRKVHVNLSVEAAGTEKRGVENFHAVRGSQYDDTRVCAESVHFSKQLVERVLAFVVAAHRGIFAAGASNGVNLVDEDDAGRFRLCLLEEIAHAACAHADEHLYKVGTCHGKERHVGFSGHGLCEKRFSGARRTYEESAFGNFTAQFGVFLRIL